MVDLLKAFGRGILYILCFPFFLVALAIFAVIGLLAFIFQLIKSIFYFFTGQKFFPELPEDKELRLMKEAEEAKNNPQPQSQPQVNNQGQGGLLYEETYDEDDFLEEPTPETPLPRRQTTIEEVVFEEEPAPEVAPVQAPVEETPAPQPQVQEEVKPEPVKELIPDDHEDPLDDFLDPFGEDSKPVEEEEELEVYRPKGTTDDTYSIDEDDDTDSGVNINFDDWGKR